MMGGGILCHNQSITSFLIILVVRDNSKVGVCDVVEVFCLRARESVGFVVAGQSGLVKDGLVSAHEREVSHFDELSKIILNGKADVEDFAIVVDVSIVTVAATIAVEVLRERSLTEDKLCSGGELVGHPGVGGGGAQGEENEDDAGHYDLL